MEIIVILEGTIVQMNVNPSALKTFGGRVKTLRRLAGMTQPELVAQCHKRAIRATPDIPAEDVKPPFSQGYLSKLENDSSSDIALPSAEIVLVLADVLDTTTDFLLGRTLDPSPMAVEASGFVTQEARRAARIIDNMPPDERRHVMALVANAAKVSAAADQNLDRKLSEVLASIERLAGPDVRAEIESTIGQ